MADPEDRQQAVAEGRERGETIAAIGRRLGLSASAVRYWLSKGRRALDGHPVRRPGRPAILDPAGQELLRQMLVERPTSTLAEILVEMERRSGTHLEEGTARQYLRRMGVRRVRPVAAEGAEAPPTETSARYEARHRRKPTRTTYPSDLTDAEWEVLRPVFTPETGPGRPAQYDRRRILDAIFYVVRGGGAWRMLPHDFPLWQNVYAHFRRWSAAGLFERMHDVLRARWREREGKRPTATAGVVDSQSAKTTEKGGPAVTTPARRSRDESATSS